MKLLPNLDLCKYKLTTSHEYNAALQYSFCRSLIKYQSIFFYVVKQVTINVNIFSNSFLTYLLHYGVLILRVFFLS